MGGLMMGGIRASGTPRPPTWMALGHGGIAAAGLIALIYAAATGPLPTVALIALGCFVLSALGGFTLFGLFHLKAKPMPMPLVIGHGLIAVTGFVLLLLGIFG